MSLIGKIEKQIEAAKRAQTKRLGQSGAAGKRKRCKKGKSCGATCINSGKVCLVDIPWVTSSQIKKVASAVSERDKVPPEKKSRSLSKLETADDFARSYTETREYYNNSIKREHQDIGKIMANEMSEYKRKKLEYEGDDVEKAKEMRKALLKRLGVSSLSEVYNDIAEYTGDSHKEIRDVQLGRTNDYSGRSVRKYMGMGDRIEELLGAPELRKPEVEKFRGKRVTEEGLAGMIQSARKGEKYEGGALSSWSSSLKVAKEFADEKDSYNPSRDRLIILRTINKRGVPIESVSSVPGEYELLTPGTSNYKYIGYRPITYLGQIYHVFDVEET